MAGDAREASIIWNIRKSSNTALLQDGRARNHWLATCEAFTGSIHPALDSRIYAPLLLERGHLRRSDPRRAAHGRRTPSSGRGVSV